MKKNTVLFLTDFSANARHAIRYGLEAFPGEDFSYILLHSYPRIHTTADVTISLSEKMRKESYEALGREEEAIRTMTGRDVRFEKVAYLGFLNEAVNAVADAMEPDLVIMGTKGETGLPAILLGSHASSLIKAINLPLLIVPEEASFTGIREIILAADAGTINKPVHLEPLSDLVATFDSRLTVINVVEDHHEPEVEESEDGKALRARFGDHLISFKTVHDPRVEHGIAHYVHDYPCDLLVVVERSRSFIVDLFHRSVSRHLALHTETPLLVLHA